MTQIAVWTFSASAAFVFYVLVGYPALLALLSAGRRSEVERRWTPRTVSIVIPVHNGEPWIRDKLASISKLNYPKDLLQIILVDDGSTDRSVSVVKQLESESLELISLPRGGKAQALNAGIARARGEILVLTDVRQPLDPDSVRSLTSHFNDSSIGVVSGELVILRGETQQEADIGLYWRYEKWLRRRMSRLDLGLGATGCLYAMRRDLAVIMPGNTILDDVHLPLAAFFRGYRVLFDSRARVFDYPTSLRSEFRRKIRTQAGVYQLIGAFPRLMLPTSPMFLHFVSYKLGRLLLPYALGVLFVTSFGLPGGWRLVAVGSQLMFYGLAALDGAIPESWWLKRVSSIARTFAVLCSAAACAPAFLIMNRGAQGWTTTEIGRPVGSVRTESR